MLAIKGDCSGPEPFDMSIPLLTIDECIGGPALKGAVANREVAGNPFAPAGGV
jgi:hypothetical protein